jgi:hypothetical protein
MIAVTRFLWALVWTSLAAVPLACSSSSTPSARASDAGTDAGGEAGGETGTGGDGGGSGSCTTGDASSCAPSEICGFAESQGCQAKGSCFPRGALCNLFQPGCACDGENINVACSGLPNGYVTAPLLHTGACTAADGGGD